MPDGVLNLAGGCTTMPVSGGLPRRPSREHQGLGGTSSFGATGRAIEALREGGSMKKWSFVVLLVMGAMILGATVLREPIAHAAQTTATTIVGPLDANGNVKVHEQGTVTVKSGDQTQLVFNDTLI
jgi:hypothetical protein